jgi:ABC-type sugar transport system ATPase subunit
MNDPSKGPPAGNGDIVLELKNITKLYDGAIALEGVSLRIRRGEVHGIIGKNGAGKSTLVGIISGIISPSRGEIIIKGRSHSSLSPRAAKKQHISIITQEPQIIGESTVAENFFMPRYIDGRPFINWRQVERKSREILEAASFPIDVTRKMRDLSISERQLLLVIKACYIENTDIIIMDEVSASLTQKDQAILYGIIAERIRAGKTVIFISHLIGELLRVCNRVTVLRDGRTVSSAYCRDLDIKSLSGLIVGDENYDTAAAEDQSGAVREGVVFELRNFTNYGKFQDVNIRLRRGEIVGIAGLRGSGRTEIFKSVIGADKYDSGSIMVKGLKTRYRSPAQAWGKGVMYLPEEREAEGLVGIASIAHNITVSVLKQISRFGIIRRRLEELRADSLIQTLNIKTSSREQKLHQLSGGNKQKVLVGRIMAYAPLVCLLDEPTRGVDIESKESILQTINRELRGSSCVLLTSPGIDDLIKICDRILVLYEGRIIDEFHRGEFNEQNIYRATQGEIIHASA